MKYIKEYELFSFDPPPVKKYIIWKNPRLTNDGLLVDDALNLCETQAFAMSDDVKLTTLYKYKDNKLQKIKDVKEMHNNSYHKYSGLKYCILYESDSLKDCLDQIKTLEIRNKFNI